MWAPRPKQPHAASRALGLEGFGGFRVDGFGFTALAASRGLGLRALLVGLFGSLQLRVF